MHAGVPPPHVTMISGAKWVGHFGEKILGVDPKREPKRIKANFLARTPHQNGISPKLKHSLRVT